MAAGQRQQGGCERERVVASAVAAAPGLLIAQVSGRLITFVANAVTLSRLSPAAVAVGALQYPTLLSGVLYLAREPLRNAAQRVRLGSDDMSTSDGLALVQKVSNAAWFNVLLGLLLCLVYYTAAVRGESSELAAFPEYRLGLVLMCLAALLELAAEPAYLLTKSLLLFHVPPQVERLGWIARGLTCYLLIRFVPSLGVLGFPIAHIVFSLVFTTMLWLRFLRTYGIASPVVRALVPRFSGPGTTLDPGFRRLWSSMAAQAFLQHFLTDGEKMVAWAVGTLNGQGVYSLAVNLGSTIARMVFLPTEELSRDVFSKLAAAAKAKSSSSNEDITAFRDIVMTMVRLMLLVGLVGLSLGPNYTTLLIHLLYSETWAKTDAPSILAAYTGYVALIAVNGITEAFKRSVATPAEILLFSSYMIGFILVYIATAVLVVPHVGIVGLLLANCVSMALRITHSLVFIHRYFASSVGFPVLRVLPRLGTILALTTAHAATRASAGAWNNGLGSMHHAAAHVGVGLVSLAMLALAVFKAERDLLQSLASLRASRRTASDKAKSD